MGTNSLRGMTPEEQVILIDRPIHVYVPPEFVRDPRLVEGGQQITAAIRREQAIREQLAIEPHPFVFGPAYPFIEPYNQYLEREAVYEDLD